MPERSSPNPVASLNQLPRPEQDLDTPAWVSPKSKKKAQETRNTFQALEQLGDADSDPDGFSRPGVGEQERKKLEQEDHPADPKEPKPPEKNPANPKNPPYKKKAKKKAKNKKNNAPAQNTDPSASLSHVASQAISFLRAGAADMTRSAQAVVVSSTDESESATAAASSSSSDEEEEEGEDTGAFRLSRNTFNALAPFPAQPGRCFGS
ncbi:hypothetical protein NEMBOFW57_008818 [Staphylotrichum longicolle]|uniref:Uncharacterized protein n=1 Tax=Staphylotrichum longicolle TaxID=669026 RepID=A0AAD4EVU0_9PEZI|nr:hypothetical protein NEMBOFW57_008818 [Staphylotrichum longicolle]